jgi:hypothetical protein
VAAKTPKLANSNSVQDLLVVHPTTPPPGEHLGLFRGEQTYFTATAESYRVYIGANSQKSNMYAYKTMA